MSATAQGGAGWVWASIGLDLQPGRPYSFAGTFQQPLFTLLWLLNYSCLTHHILEEKGRQKREGGKKEGKGKRKEGKKKEERRKEKERKEKQNETKRKEKKGFTLDPGSSQPDQSSCWGDVEKMGEGSVPGCYEPLPCESVRWGQFCAFLGLD